MTNENGRAVATREDARLAEYFGGTERRLAAEQQRRDLIREQLAPGASELEFEYFIQTARELGLSPLSREIYAVMRNTSVQEGGQWVTRPKMTIQIGIDGFRSIGSRTGRFGGMRGPWWCGEDGQWRDVWLSDAPPAAAKVEIVLADTRETVTGIATWREFRQITPARPGGRRKDGSSYPPRAEKLADMWEKMPSHMLAKVAEAQAWRKALSPQTVAVLTSHRVEFSPGDPSPPAVTLHQADGESDDAFRGRVREAKALRDALIDEGNPAGDATVDDLYGPDPDAPMPASAAIPPRNRAEEEDARRRGSVVDPDTGEITGHADDGYLGVCSADGCKLPASHYGPEGEALCDEHRAPEAEAADAAREISPGRTFANQGEFLRWAMSIGLKESKTRGLVSEQISELLGSDDWKGASADALAEAGAKLLAALTPK